MSREEHRPTQDDTSETSPKLNLDHFKKFSPRHLFANFKNDFIAASGEFLGTFSFLVIGLGGIQASATSTLANEDPNSPNISNAIERTPSLEQLTYISLSMGLSLLFSAWIFFRITGAAFNPNVSFALLLIGAISPLRFILYTMAQLSASIAACGFLEALIPGTLSINPTMRADISPARGVFIECSVTCCLVLSVLFLAVEKHRATFLAPVGIGITLFAGHLFAVVYTGAAMNTARAFGPSVVGGFKSDHWIYWVGPTIGSVLGVVIYAFLKRFEYWKLVKEQDTDEFEQSPALFVPRQSLTSSSGTRCEGPKGERSFEEKGWFPSMPTLSPAKRRFRSSSSTSPIKTPFITPPRSAPLTGPDLV